MLCYRTIMLLTNNFQALVNHKKRIPQVSFFKRWLYKHLNLPNQLSMTILQKNLHFCTSGLYFLQNSYFSVLKRFDLETAFRDTSVVLLQKV